MQHSIHQTIDTIADFCGTVWFLLANGIVFFIWILLNTIFPRWLHFDSFPFQFLTLSVSLEAIFLSIFVLISQNRQGKSDRARAEQEFMLNVKEEAQNENIIERLERIEHKLES